jgi:Zn-dependent peptidase ImmA (M78 family)/transcriptional regulator with XRE-family HTH domain
MTEFAQIAQRLREARRTQGIDVDALARDARVPRTVLAQLERGEVVSISTAALARVARRLSLPSTALLSPSTEHELDLSLHFRHASVPDFFHADEAVARKAILVARTVDGLDALLNRQEPLRKWFDPKPVGHVPYEDGYARARHVRQILHRTDHLPSTTAPLPNSIESFIEDTFGVPVLDERLATDSVLAFTAKDRATGLSAMVLNQSSEWAMNLFRRRVDVAHELAHTLFDEREEREEREEPLALWIDKEDTEEENTRPGSENPVEQRANAFAAELLIPKMGLRELLGLPPSDRASREQAIERVRRVREHFMTPVELTVHHLANHGYLPQYLHDEIVAIAPGPSTIAPSSRNSMLRRRVQEARATGRISAMRARELLGLSAWDALPWGEQ